jgi:hypothetical protein
VPIWATLNVRSSRARVPNAPVDTGPSRVSSLLRRLVRSAEIDDPTTAPEVKDSTADMTTGRRGARTSIIPSCRFSRDAGSSSCVLRGTTASPRSGGLTLFQISFTGEMRRWCSEGFAETEDGKDSEG